MSSPRKFVENLSTEELESLEAGYKYGASPDYRKRCQGILLSHQGHGISAIAEILNCSYLAVYQWIDKWHASGMEGLIRKSGQGRKRKLLLSNPQHVKVVKAAAKQHAQSSAQMLEEVKTALQIEDLSKKSLKRFLKKLVTDGSDSAEG